MKVNILLIILLSILLLFIILNSKSADILTLFYRKTGLLENFEDKFDEDESYNEIYDKEFTDLYEIIYRDFTDIDHDVNIVYSKCVNTITNKDDLNFLICGSGVGKLCKKIKEKYKNVIGVDISENMLKKAQSLYPNIKFIKGNIIKANIFNKNTFSHIYIDERTLYYNKYETMDKIIKNIHGWLKDNGFLIIQIYNPDKLQLASRYYSSKYIDNKGNVHGFTYLNDFSHDCYYVKDEENKEIVYYFDKIVLDSGHKRIKKTTFYIPSKEKIYDLILNSGFDVFYIEKVRIQIVGGYELAIFRKKNLTVLVDDLEKNK
jgi:ubiquinone/menaquinone biosynthesis C-methylase UbiE